MPCLEDLRLMAYLHGGFPLVDEPYAAVAQALGTTEQDVLQRLQRLLDDGYLTRFGPLFQIERAGGQFVLAALAAPEAQFDAVTAQVNALPEVAHNYRREHALKRIEGATGLKVHAFPKEREYRVELRLPLLPPGETLPPPLEVPHGAGCV